MNALYDEIDRLKKVTGELVGAIRNLRSFYYRKIDAVCQKGIMEWCMCRKCIEDRADAAIAKAEEP